MRFALKLLTILFCCVSLRATCTTPCIDSQLVTLNGPASGTTPAMNNTGATSLWVLESCFTQNCDATTVTTASPTTSLTCNASVSVGGGTARLCYSLTPTVGSAQTVSFASCSAACSLYTMSLSGTAAIDGSITSASTMTISLSSFQGTGVTTSGNNEIVVSTLGTYCGSSGTLAIDSSFNLAQGTCSNTLMDGGISYRLLTTAGSVNPTWSNGVGLFSGAVIFNIALSAPSAGGTKHRNKTIF